MPNGNEVTAQFNDDDNVCAYVKLVSLEIRLDLFKLSRALPGNQMLKQLAMLTAVKSKSELLIAKSLRAKLLATDVPVVPFPGTPGQNVPNLINFYPVPENFLDDNKTIDAFKQEIYVETAVGSEVSGDILMIPCYQEPTNVFKMFETTGKKEKLRGVRYGNAIFVYREYGTRNNLVNYFVDELALNQEKLGGSKALDDMFEYFAHKASEDNQYSNRYIMGKSLIGK